MKYFQKIAFAKALNDYSIVNKFITYRKENQ